MKTWGSSGWTLKHYTLEEFALLVNVEDFAIKESKKFGLTPLEFIEYTRDLLLTQETEDGDS